MRITCPICKSNSQKVLKKVKFVLPEHFHLPNWYDVVACTNCGFCFAATQAQLEDYDHYYKKCNFYSGVPNESDGKRVLNQRIVKFSENTSSKEDCFLDIGFGKGNLMRQLKQIGFHHIVGLDPSTESVAQLKKEGFEVHLGSIFNEVKPSFRKKFDCVFLIDVLEHLLYPEKAVMLAADYIKDGGKLIISVPNYAVLIGDSSPVPNHFNQEHINYFSPISLDNLLAENNFYRIENCHFNSEAGDNLELLLAYRYSSNKVQFEFKKDNICCEALIKYFERNNGLAQSVNDRIAPFCADKSSVYIWGTGAYTMWLLANTKLGEMNIAAFIDNNPTKIGKRLAGKMIISPDEIETDIPILICTMKHSEKIISQMKHLNAANLLLSVGGNIP